MPIPLQTAPDIASVHRQHGPLGLFLAAIGLGALTLLSACATGTPPRAGYESSGTLIEKQTACTAGNIAACNAANAQAQGL
jgi:hypothetical protein